MTKPYCVTMTYDQNVAGPYRPKRFETKTKTETVWADNRAKARRIVVGWYEDAVTITSVDLLAGWDN